MGKYTVDHWIVNCHPLTAASCTDSVLTLVYFDQANERVFEYNSRDRRLFGTYRLDETGFTLSGKMGNTMVQANLQKVDQ